MANTYRLIYEVLTSDGVKQAEHRMNVLAAQGFELFTITTTAPGPLVDGGAESAELLAVMVGYPPVRADDRLEAA